MSALPITAIVYIVALLPWFDSSAQELILFTVSAVLLIVGIGMFNLGADLAMTPMGTHVGAGLSQQGKLSLLLAVCFVMGLDKKAQGIAFALPVSDVAGLVKLPEEENA